MLNGLDSLQDFVDDGKFKPSSLDYIYYLFFEKGISLIEFEKLPLSYIYRMLATHNHIKEEEIKANKKAAKK